MIPVGDKRFNQELDKFGRVLRLFQQIKSDYEQDRGSVTSQTALAHAFVMLFEVSWKLMGYIIRDNGEDSGYSPKITIVKAERQGIIRDAESWIKALRNRNLISHVYDAKISQQVLDFAEREFSVLVADLNQKLTRKGGERDSTNDEIRP